ncbi:MAG TPA: Wzz/FepE/Etk N-terminal domain-containing protein [Fimbriimonadaceae bacterium]|nr:Wzz/FepE/Etk N-terminal domain-containing protein [Fimbriimonadaceae bacterium]
MTPQNGPDQIQPIFAPVMARKRLAFVIVCIALACGVCYTLFAPAVWKAEATIIFPVRESSVFGPDIQDAGSLATALGGSSPVKIFAGILESDRTTEHVSEATGLSRKEVEKMSQVLDRSAKSSITISAKSSSATLAKSVVALKLEALNQINKQLNMPDAQNDVSLLADKISQEKAALKQAEDSLVAFQKTAVTGPSITPSGSGKDTVLLAAPTNWVETLRKLEIDHARVETEIKRVKNWSDQVAKNGQDLPTPFPGSETWRNKLSELEYELQVTKLSYAPTSPEVQKLQKQIDITKAQLQDELAKFTQATKEGLIDPSGSGSQKLPGLMTESLAIEAQISAVRRLANVAPAEAVELTRIMRDVATHTVILQQLQERHEMAVIQQDRDPNRWEVLDQPHLLDDPVNKSWIRNTAVSLLMGIVLAVATTMAMGFPAAKPLEIAKDDEERGRAA